MKPTNSTGRKPIALALQGGGSHGAFTWGVLDRLLSDERIEIHAVSGTSAGALNAVALASGLATAKPPVNPSAAARQALQRVWTDIGHWGALGEWHAKLGRALLWGGVDAAAMWTQAWSGLVSPYQSNPLNLQPLRDLLDRHVDFNAMQRAGQPPVFVSATDVSTGKAVIFHGPQLHADAVLASSCLPTLFQAIEIDGHAYWDGGFAVNPALTPLIDSCEDADIMIVQINPLQRNAVPRTAADIRDRMNELTFNASLLTQVRAIEFVNRLLTEGLLAPGSRKLVRVHRIDGGERMLAYSAASKARTDPGMIRDLFQLGRDCASEWLDRHFDALGRHGTIDMQGDYLDDTRLPWPATTPPTPRPAPIKAMGALPWMTRLFKRGRAR